MSTFHLVVVSYINLDKFSEMVFEMTHFYADFNSFEPYLQMQPCQHSAITALYRCPRRGRQCLLDLPSYGERKSEKTNKGNFFTRKFILN